MSGTLEWDLRCLLPDPCSGSADGNGCWHLHGHDHGFSAFRPDTGHGTLARKYLPGVFYRIEAMFLKALPMYLPGLDPE